MPILICERGDAKGTTIKLEPGGTYVVGRDPKSTIPVGDIMLSRRHFEITANGENYYLNDLASRNGTFLNDEPVTRELSLAIGDKIQAGECVFSFLSDRKEESAGGLVGKTIGGYKVLERVGRGGMGTVYKANQLSLNRVVALKVLSARLLKDTSFVDKFKAEARAAGALNHPNIVQVFDVGTEGGLHFFSMEFIDGGSLQDSLGTDEAIEWSEALPLMMDAARGLVYAETRDIVHRDIKPDNLMLTSDGRVKIGDLGLAIEKSAVKGESNAIFGTPHFISPEQARGQEVGHFADLYSLGATFYRILGGRTPFQGESVKDIIRQQIKDEPVALEKLNPAIPDDLCDVVRKLMRKNASERFGSAQELVDELEKIRIRHHLGVKAGSRRALVIALIVVLLAAGAAVAYFSSRDPVVIDKGESEADRLAREKEEAERAEERRRARAKLFATEANAAYNEIRGAAPDFHGKVTEANHTDARWDTVVAKIQSDVIEKYEDTDAATEARTWIETVEAARKKIRDGIDADKEEAERKRVAAEQSLVAAETAVRAEVEAKRFGKAMETLKTTDRKPFADYEAFTKRFDGLESEVTTAAGAYLDSIKRQLAPEIAKSDDFDSLKSALDGANALSKEWPNRSEPVFADGRAWAAKTISFLESGIRTHGLRMIAADRARWIDMLVELRRFGDGGHNAIFAYQFEAAAKALEAKRGELETTAFRARLDRKVSDLRRMERAVKTIVSSLNGGGRILRTREYSDSAEGELVSATRDGFLWTGKIRGVELRKVIAFDSLTPAEFVDKLVRTRADGALRFELTLEDRLDFALLFTELGRARDGRSILGLTKDFPDSMKEEFRRVASFVDSENVASLDWAGIRKAREDAGTDPARLRAVLARLAQFRSVFETTEFYLLVGGRPADTTAILSSAELNAYLDSLLK